MKKTVLTICFSLLFVLVACKKEDAGATGSETPKEEPTNSFQLSNLTDANWNKGVGVEGDMFLVDKTSQTETLLKDVKLIELADSTQVGVTSTEVQGDYIRLHISGKASDYQQEAQYPNKITVK